MKEKSYHVEEAIRERRGLLKSFDSETQKLKFGMEKVIHSIQVNCFQFPNTIHVDQRTQYFSNRGVFARLAKAKSKYFIIYKFFI